MTDGAIELDSPDGKELGFTSDKFGVGSYLWLNDNRLIVSFISSMRKGNFRRLVARSMSLGLSVCIPTPLGRMREIVRKNGYTWTEEHSDILGVVDLWTLHPPSKERDGEQHKKGL